MLVGNLERAKGERFALPKKGNMWSRMGKPTADAFYAEAKGYQLESLAFDPVFQASASLFYLSLMFPAPVLPDTATWG